MKITRFFSIFVLSSIFLSMQSGWAADPVPAQKQAPTPASDQGVQALLSTLNETLEENRRIRENLSSLQELVEGKTLENSRLKSQLQQLEKLSLQSNQELKDKAQRLEQKINEMGKQVKEQVEGTVESLEEKARIQKNLEGIKNENEELRKLLSESILESEKQEIIETSKTNKIAVIKAVKDLSEIHYENETLKQELDEAYFLLGNSLFELHDYWGAVTQYRRALQWNEHNLWAHHNLAVVYDYYLDQKDLALRHYERYLNYEPLEKNAHEVRERTIQLKLQKKLVPSLPLKLDFEELHKDAPQ